MSDVIACNVCMFTANAKVMLPNGTVQTVPMSDITQFIPHVCNQNNVYKVHLFGNKEYIDGLIQEMETTEVTNYGLIKINYEVN